MCRQGKFWWNIFDRTFLVDNFKCKFLFYNLGSSNTLLLKNIAYVGETVCLCLWHCQLTHTLHSAWVKIQVWEARSRKLGAGSINGRRGGSLEAPGIRTIDPSRALWSQDYPSSPFHSASMAKFFLFGESTNAQLGWFIFQNSKRTLTSSKIKFNHPQRPRLKEEK